jgi:hypothetical protein
LCITLILSHFYCVSAWQWFSNPFLPTWQAAKTKCIKHEGGNSAANRDTCKSRSASTAKGGGKQRDFMADFKSC